MWPNASFARRTDGGGLTPLEEFSSPHTLCHATQDIDPESLLSMGLKNGPFHRIFFSVSPLQRSLFQIGVLLPLPGRPLPPLGSVLLFTEGESFHVPEIDSFIIELEIKSISVQLFFAAASNPLSRNPLKLRLTDSIKKSSSWWTTTHLGHD